MPEQSDLSIADVVDDLDSVKAIMFTLARQYERIDITIDRISAQQEANSQAIASLTTQMQQLGNFMMQLGEDVRGMQSDVREMQAEVRGLQVENRRILQHVFGDEF